MSAPDKTFAPGDTVSLKHLRRRGIISEGPNRKGEFLVVCGNLSLWVSAAALEAVDPGKASKKSEKKEKVIRRPAPEGAGSAMMRLDLHGKSREEAVRLLEDAIDRALRSEGPRGESISIEVVHGIGSGAVKGAIREYLARSRVVSSFRDDVSNPGVTWVYL